MTEWTFIGRGNLPTSNEDVQRNQTSSTDKYFIFREWNGTLKKKSLITFNL